MRVLFSGLRKTVTLTANELEDKLNEDLCFCGYACATDLDANMPYSDHRRFTIAQPTIILTVTFSTICLLTCKNLDYY